MSMFPPAWEAALSLDQLSDKCPYSVSEIEDYLFGNHYHLHLSEEPTTFEVLGLRAQKVDATRRWWLFEAVDRNQRRSWFVVIGTGKSFSDPSKKLKRWMYAKTNDEGLSPEQFLDDEYNEQLEHDARS